MKAVLVTQAEVEDYHTRLQSMEDSLAIHAQASFATAHRTISAAPTAAYTNANGISLGDHVLVVALEGQVLYLPCRLVIGDSPTT